MSDQQSSGLNAIAGHGANTLLTGGSLAAILVQHPQLLSSPYTAVPLGIIAIGFAVSTFLPGILKAVKDFRSN
jgi:hypothetical protein